MNNVNMVVDEEFTIKVMSIIRQSVPESFAAKLDDNQLYKFEEIGDHGFSFPEHIYKLPRHILEQAEEDKFVFTEEELQMFDIIQKAMDERDCSYFRFI